MGKHHQTVAVCGLISLSVGLVSLLGWVVGSPWLTSFRPEFWPVAPKGALALVLMSVCLIGHARITLRPGREVSGTPILAAAAGFVVVFGWSVIEHFLPDRFALERRLFPVPVGFDAELAFQISGLGMAFLAVAGLSVFSLLLRSGEKASVWVSVSGAGIAIASGMGLLGYLYGAPQFYGGSFRPAPLPGIIATLAFGLGLVWAAGPDNIPLRWFVGPSMKSQLLRLLLPWALVIIALNDFLSRLFAGQPESSAFGAVHATVSLVAMGLVLALISRKLGRIVDRAAVERTTELEAANRALRASEQLLESTWQSALDGKRLTDESGRIVKVNDAYCALMQMPREALEGHPMHAPYPPENAADILAKHCERFRNRTIPSHLEREVTLVSGQRLYLELSNSFIEAPGRPTLLLTVYRDITGRKQAETERRNQEARLRRALEAAQMVTWELDAARRTLVYSDNLNAFVGGEGIAPYCSLDAVLQEIHPDDRHALAVALEVTLTRGGSFEREYRARMLDGTYRWILAKGQAVTDANGKVTSILGVSSNIMERKRMESEITQISDYERQRIGHEIHDGLGGFLAGIAFRAKSLELTLEPEAHHLTVQAHEVVMLINDSIVQARTIARGLAPMDLVERDFWSAVNRLAQDTSKLFRVQCSFVGEAPLPVPNKSAGLHLYRITQEAVRNAIEHGGASTVRICASATNSELFLEIRDDGKGADPQEDFDQGLGLRIMRHRARAVGGTLEVNLQGPNGATVCCRVPVGSLRDAKSGKEM